MAATRVKKKVSKKKPVTHKVKKAKTTKKTTKPKSKFASLLRSVKNAVKLSHKPTKTIAPKAPLEKVDAAFNKSKLLSTLAEHAELNKRQISTILDTFCHIMGLHVKKGGPEKFILPGAFKIVVRKMPARKARTGINPFTGESTVFKAKPAFRRVRIIPLKGLKEMAHK
jgi:nucleoid DNA-binding protein